MEDVRSIVEYFYHENDDKTGSRCGYCKQNKTSISQGMWGHVVTCQDYEDLIDRGWRRSGKYLYKPDMRRTCCPLYTIRCDALNFQLSKSQKKVLKKVTKFLKGESKVVDETTVSKVNDTMENLKGSCEVDEAQDVSSGEVRKMSEENKSLGADPSKPKCRKAKVVRMERRREKLAARGMEMPEKTKAVNQEKKTLEDFIASHQATDESGHKLEIKLLKCNPNLPEFQTSYRKSFELFCKYQKEIHKDKPEKLNESRFRRFLIDSPLVFVKNSNTPHTGCGSFHEQFILDGKLIAVGVLDILPNCVSSVYFYYDPDYSFLSLGVYSALRELHLTRELNKSFSQSKYYYMGFYVHSCPKMRYKADYRPSYLACPESYSWVPLEKCIPKLDVSKYSRLDESNKEDPAVDLGSVLVLFRNFGFMSYQNYRCCSKSKSDFDEVKQYAQLVGSLVATRMALYRD